MAYTNNKGQRITLPKVASMARTLRQDYNWPERSRPNYAATRMGASMIPIPSPEVFASEAGAMWQPASVNATMPPGFYASSRMGAFPVSPVAVEMSAVQRVRSQGLGSYEDMGYESVGFVPSTPGAVPTVTAPKPGPILSSVSRLGNKVTAYLGGKTYRYDLALAPGCPAPPTYTVSWVQKDGSMYQVTNPDFLAFDACYQKALAAAAATADAANRTAITTTIQAGKDANTIYADCKARTGAFINSHVTEWNRIKQAARDEAAKAGGTAAQIQAAGDYAAAKYVASGTGLTVEMVLRCTTDIGYSASFGIGAGTSLDALATAAIEKVIAGIKGIAGAMAATASGNTLSTFSKDPAPMIGSSVTAQAVYNQAAQQMAALTSGAPIVSVPGTGAGVAIVPLGPGVQTVPSETLAKARKAAASSGGGGSGPADSRVVEEGLIPPPEVTMATTGSPFPIRTLLIASALGVGAYLLLKKKRK